MLAIIQARLSSVRLPGKVLRDLCGRPLLGRVLDRLSNAKMLSNIIVATSNDGGDDAIADFCAAEGVRCYRGCLDDVADRLRQAAQREAADAFVRISGDSPLIDPALVDQAIQYYQLRESDLVTNVFVRSFPKGQSVEVLRFKVFEQLCDTYIRADQKEHVTKGFYENPYPFRIVNFTSGMQAGAFNLSVDTEDDFKRIETLIDTVPDTTTGWRDLLASYQSLV